MPQIDLTRLMMHQLLDLLSFHLILVLSHLILQLMVGNPGTGIRWGGWK